MCFRVVGLLFAAFILVAQTPEATIREELSRQVEAWNRGDIPSFMEGYENSPHTTFVGKAVTKGHAQVLADYKKRYPSKAQMGSLRFTILEVQMLGAEHANVLGRFALKRTKEAGGDTSGIFTLLFRKTGKGWKIIQDHTS